MNYVDASKHNFLLSTSGTAVIPTRTHKISVFQRVSIASALVVSTILAASDLKAATQNASNEDSQSTDSTPSKLKSALTKLPIAAPDGIPKSDYLIDPGPFTAKVSRSKDGRTLILSNGLIRRVWRLSPNGACVAFDNLMTDQAMLRSVRPEARLTIDGKQLDVGGLVGQPNHAFLAPEWLAKMRANPKAPTARRPSKQESQLRGSHGVKFATQRPT